MSTTVSFYVELLISVYMSQGCTSDAKSTDLLDPSLHYKQTQDQLISLIRTLSVRSMSKACSRDSPFQLQVFNQ